jgi:CBS domain-containing protein
MKRMRTISSQTVSDVMTNLVVTLRAEDKITLAAKRLLSNRISGAPVVQDGRLVGVVSEADLIKAYAPPPRRGFPFVSPHPVTWLLLQGSPPREVDGTVVGDVMTKRVISIGPDASVWAAASLIDHHRVRRLPVVDRDGYVVGVLTRSDLVRCMAGGGEVASDDRMPA